MKRLAAVAAFTALALAGCVSVGPDYRRPQLDAPAGFEDGRMTANAAPGLELAGWWKTFGDPVLDELMVEAARANLDVAQAQARISQARADVTIARAAALPMLNASGQSATAYTDQRATADNADASSMEPASPNTLYRAGFDVSWELDVFGGLRRQREASRASLDASIEDVRATVLTLTGDVAASYVELREYQQRLAIAKASAQSQQHNVDVTRERYRVGLTSHLDVSQAQAQLASTQAAIPTYEANARKAIHRLGVLLGRDPAALTQRLSPARPLPAPEAAYAVGLPSELLDRRPDLRKVERQLAAASANIGVAAAAQYPSFDLTMGLGLQGNVLNSFLGLANWYWSLIPSVAAPVFDAGKSRAGVARKQAVYDEALAKYRASYLTALEEVANALMAISAEKQRKQSLELAIKANEEALSLARERYTKGLTSFLDVLSAEKSLFEAQESACASSASLLKNLVTLYKSVGGGWDCPDLPYQRTAQR